MKHSSTISFLCRLSLSLTLLLAAACQQEQDDMLNAGDSTQATGSVEVGFTLTTGSGAATTRVYTEIEAGNDAENYIDIANSNFRFLLFNTDSCYLESFEPTSVTPAGTAENGKYQYYVQGELSQAYSDFKLVVLANWPTYPDDNDLTVGETTIEDVCTATTAAYNYDSDFWPSTEDLIPMYGVCTYNGITLTPNLSTDLGTIDLLRAMSKVQVTCSADGFTLTGVTLHNYYTSGMCAPKGIYSNTEEYLEEEKEVIHLPDNPTTSTELALTKTDENTYVAYVPEYDNAAKEDAYLSVTLQNANGEEVILNGSKPSIYFQTYENGTAKGDNYDLVRNHWYNYEITAVNEEILTIEYNVLPWNLVESAIGWNPDENDVTMAAWNFKDINDATSGDEEANYCYVLYPRYLNNAHDSLEYKPSYAGFYFQLTAPEGALWEVYLTNTDDFKLNTGTYDNNTKYFVTQGIAREDPYQIQVTATHCWTDTIFTSNTSGADATNTDWGNQIEASGECKDIHTDLYIRISIDGGHTWNYLDINPVDNSITSTYWNTSTGRRRFAGEDKFIRIWQLKAKYGKAYNTLVTDLDSSWGIRDYWNPTN